MSRGARTPVDLPRRADLTEPGFAGDRAQWEKVDRILARALECSTEDRMAFVHRECGDDSALERRVVDLIEADRQAGDFLEDSPVGQLHASPPPRRVGPYLLHRVLGVGGMGVVYLASRMDGVFERLVALKIARWGLESSDSEHRFRLERQILADLEHPSIARLYDGGQTPDGRPYFAMELVEGEPIDHYCRRHRLGLEERLAVFLRVCSAVAHAHRNLLVHRDIKPTNILVTRDGVPKLLDFGIAKMLGARPGVEAVHTADSVGRLMTPRYASPEQVERLPITTATDVHGLGVLLYELLTGSLPHSADSRLPHEIERAVCEDEPVRPSLAATRGDTTGAPEDPAAARFAHRLSGDLDTIILKAIQRAPSRRYPSVEALASDLERYLDSRPIEARPDSVLYRCAKFVRRHRLATAMASIAALLGAAFITALLLQAEDLRQERATADHQRDRATHLSELVTELFRSADLYAGNPQDLTVREAVERGIPRLSAGLEDEPQLLADLLSVSGQVYLSLGVAEQAEGLFERALEIRRQELGNEHPEVAESLHNLGMALVGQGQYASGVARFNRALAIRRAQLGDAHPDTAESLSALGDAYRGEGRYEEAVELLEEALRLQEAVLDPSDPALHLTTHYLGMAYVATARLEEAESMLERSIELQLATPAPVLLSLIDTQASLGRIQHERGRFTEAAATFEEGLEAARDRIPQDHPDVLSLKHGLALAFDALDELEQSERIYREIVAAYRERGGEKHLLAVSLNNLGTVLTKRGATEEAGEIFEESIELRRLTFGLRHVEVGWSLANLAEHYRQRGVLDRAAELFREAHSILLQRAGDDHINVAIPLLGLAYVEMDRRDWVAASELLAETLRIRSLHLDPSHWKLAWVESKLAICYRQRGERAAAEELLLGAVQSLRATFGDGHYRVHAVVGELVQLYRDWDRPQEARRWEELAAD